MTEIEGINKFFLNKIQTIELDNNGLVLNSNNQLFSLVKNSNLKSFHPFFEIITNIFEEDNQEIFFNTVQLDFDNKLIVTDIIISSGNKTKNPSVLIFDQSEHYKDLQEITQQRNEIFIKNFFDNEELQKTEHEKYLKNKFLASITKDLRTPISSVAGLLGLFQKGTLSFEQNELVETIRSSIDHLNRLVNDVLDLSRSEIGQLSLDIKTFSFEELVKNVENLYRNKFLLKDIHFKVIKPFKIPNNLIGDKQRVLQIIILLLENAYSYTKSGEVFLEIKIDHINAQKLGLNFIVKDTGLGIEASNVAVINSSFNKATEAPFEGTGLGLPLIKNIVKLLNGSVKLESIINQGSIFSVFLPFEFNVTKTPKSKFKLEYKKIEITKKRHVLIADDNEINQLVLMKILLNHGGFYIDVAINGFIVTQMVQKEKYDLIFMDMHMPILDGLGAITYIRESDNKILKKTPIIVLTAIESQEEKKKCKKLKVNDYILKPYNNEDLFTAVYKAFKLK